MDFHFIHFRICFFFGTLLKSTVYPILEVDEFLNYTWSCKCFNMSAVVTSSGSKETEKFQTRQKSEMENVEMPPVENVWMKRSLEKQLSSEKQVLTAQMNSQSHDEPDKHLKTDVEKKTEEKAEEKKDEKRKGDLKDKKEEKKETVKRFDNVNFVEAPIPKTNPWNKGKIVQSTETGTYIHIPFLKETMRGIQCSR